jgi:uncharacterized protein YjeT (DUF2065 family)
MLSNYLAEIWGISFVAVSLALLINQKYLKRLFAEAEDDKNLFCWGTIAFVIGISIVLAHNIWVKNWQVIITIFGWLSLIKGLSLLFLPEYAKNWVKKMESQQWLQYALIVMLLIGLVITYFGFTA